MNLFKKLLNKSKTSSGTTKKKKDSCCNINIEEVKNAESKAQKSRD